MRKLFVIAILLFASGIVFGQKKEFDTLFFANKKYLVERSISIYRTHLSNEPFALTKCEYKIKYDLFIYSALDVRCCNTLVSFDVDGNETVAYDCSTKKFTKESINCIYDTIYYDELEKIKYSSIKI